MTLSLYSSNNSDTASLASRQHLLNSVRNWTTIFDERIYQICNVVHPGLPIELDAVEHVRAFLERIVKEIVEQRSMTVVDVDKFAKRLFSNGLHSVAKDAWDNMHSQLQKHKFQKSMKQTLEHQHKLANFVREMLGYREKEKKDKERREIEKIASYIYYVCESLTEDIIRLTGNYVKNIRNGEQKITLQNLDVALSADRALMELRIKLKNEDEAESPAGFGFLSEFDGYVAEQLDDAHKNNNATLDTYESVALEFLRDERRFIRELNRINVFRRRIESALADEDKVHLRNLFGNLHDIHDLSLKIERTLEDAIEMSDTPCIGMGIWDLAETYEFDAYSSYIVRELPDGDCEPMAPVVNQTVEFLLQSSRCELLFKMEDRCFNSSLDGPSFRLAVQYVLPQLLHAPITHFFQYVEYVNKLLRLTTSDEDRADLHNCKTSLMTARAAIDAQCSNELKSSISSFIDQLARSDKIYNVQRLHEIQSSIEGFFGSPIGKSSSELIKENDLQMVRPSVTFSAEVMKKQRWKTDRYVFLFDQLLLICKRHKTALKFKDRLAVHLMDVFDVEDTEGVQYSFRLVSRDKMQLPKSYHFICKSFEEKHSWMAAFVMVTTQSVLDRILDNYEKEEAKRVPLVIPGPDQYRFAEPDSEENISFEDYTSSSGIPVIKNGTVLKLVERLTYHSYTDSKYIQTFLISFRSFCTPSDLLKLLLERFNVPIPNKLQHSQDKRGGPLAGRYDTVQSHGLSGGSGYNPLYEQSFQRFRKEYERPVQLRVLSVVNQWVKCHWYDFECDYSLLESLEIFLQKCIDPREKLTKQHKKFCKTILSIIEKRAKNPASAEAVEHEGPLNSVFVYNDGMANGNHHTPAYANNNPPMGAFLPKKPETIWHTAQKGDVENYDLLTLHPLEIGRQLTLLHFDLYRAIKPIELVGAAWTQHDKDRRSPQLLKLTDHSTLLTYWVSRSIVETESLEERVAMFNRALEVMSVFEELHNFTGLVAFFSALNSASIHRLTWCWDRLDNEKQKCYDRFVSLCDSRWTEMQKRLQTINPPCIPFFGHYLTNIFFFEKGNSTFVKSPGPKSKESVVSDLSDANSKRVLVSFLKCRRISDIIREIQMYQNEPYPLQMEPSIRQFFESINPKSDFKNDDALETYLYEKSLEIQPKDTERPLNEVKPKHGSNSLRSPGIKPSKQANHYSVNVQQQQQQQMPHHSATAPSTPVPAHETKRSYSHTASDDSHFAMAEAALQHTQRHRANAKRNQVQPLNKIAPLQPPPIHPRSTRSTPLPPPTTNAPMVPATKTSPLVTSPSYNGSSSSVTATTPSATHGPAPKLHPRRVQPPSMSPHATSGAAGKSPLTPSTANENSSSAFQFPSVFEAANPAPLLPLKASTSSDSSSSSSTKENQEQLRVIFDRSSSESHSPTVCLSVPLPPALPPPRGSTVTQAPPPLPPKSYKLRQTSSNQQGQPGASREPSEPSTPVSPSFVNLTPPPLPPKTYRATKPGQMDTD